MSSTTLERLSTALANRYVVEEEIGRGGMAVVYRARDLRHARLVAVKVFLPEIVGQKDAAVRFLQEIRITAQLAHPHVLPLHDSGEIPGANDDPALFYYVMPFVSGRSLRERLRAMPRLPVEEALRIARAIAAALDHAHRRNILHRDIKPENILLQEGEAVVADFGVARALEAGGAQTLSVPGLAVGTPAYMSPEQAGGDEGLDGRSDEYALACVLFEMLTGKPPFTGKSWRETMAQHAVEAVPALRAQRPDAPAGVDNAVRRALAKRPADRFATVAEFADALALSESVASVVAVGAPARSIAVLPFVNSSTDPDNEYFSDGMTDELINLLANVEGLHVAPRASVFALKGHQLDTRTIGARLGVAVVLDGSVRKSGSRLRITAQLTDVAANRLLWSERFDREDRDFFAIQDELARTIVATLRANLVGNLADPVPRRYTQNLGAYNLYLRGRHSWNKRSQEGISAAIMYFERAIAEDPTYALAYTGLADSYALQLDYRAAPVAAGMRRARDMACRALELDEGLAEAHTSLAWVTFIHDWDWERAGQHFRRAIELNPRYATARQWHSWYLTALGRRESGIAEGRRAAALDPASVSVQRSLGWLLYIAGQAEAAVTQLQHAIAMNPDSHETHALLALAHASTGDAEAAQAAVCEALALGPDDTATLATQGRIAALNGQEKIARAMLDRLATLERQRYVSPVDAAKLYLSLGDFDAAFAAIERAQIERRGWLVYLRVDPFFDPVRGDPRFDTLLERMRLKHPLT